MAVNPEHVHTFYVYPPKLSPSVIAKKFKNYYRIIMVRLLKGSKWPRTTSDARKGILGDDWRGQLDFGFMGSNTE